MDQRSVRRIEIKCVLCGKGILVTNRMAMYCDKCKVESKFRNEVKKLMIKEGYDVGRLADIIMEVYMRL